MSMFASILLLGVGGLFFCVNVIGFILENDWYVTSEHLFRYMLCLCVCLSVAALSLLLFYLKHGSVKEAIKDFCN